MAVKLLKHTPYSSGLQMLSLPCTCLFTYENRSCVQLSWKSHNMQMQITRKTYSVEKKKKKKDRQFKLLLHSLMIHLFSWALNAEFWAVQRKPQVALIMIICSRWMLQMCNKCIGGIYCINTLILFLSIYIHNPIPLYCMIYLSSS